MSDDELRISRRPATQFATLKTQRQTNWLGIIQTLLLVAVAILFFWQHKASKPSAAPTDAGTSVRARGEAETIDGWAQYLTDLADIHKKVIEEKRAGTINGPTLKQKLKADTAAARAKMSETIGAAADKAIGNGKDFDAQSELEWFEGANDAFKKIRAQVNQVR